MVATVDLVLSVVAVYTAFALRFLVFDPNLTEFRGLALERYVLLGLILATSQIVILGLMSFYRRQLFLAFVDEVGFLLGGVVLNIIFSFATLYYLRIYDVSRLLPLVYGAALLLFLLTGHFVFRRVLSYRRHQGKGLRDLVIVGGNATAMKTAEALERNPLAGYRVLGFLLEGHEKKPLVPHEKVLGSLSELEASLEKYQPGDLIYTGDKNYQENLKQVLEACDAHGVQLHVVPSFGELVAVRGYLASLDGMPLISVRDIPARTGFNRVLKRTFDILFSGAFLLVFSPVFLLIALAVKFSSRGPVFFAQERVGLDNKVFKIIKFRTMRVQTEQASNTIWTTKDDPRITPIGKFLRQSSLDEIPQFFNIFIGQMSVVGPRPERPFFVEQFKDKYRYFKRRHAVKAGLTGWAQINGLRGDTSIQDRIDADLFYIENWTFFLDLKIVALTPFKGMIHKNAY